MTPGPRQKITPSVNFFSHFCCHQWFTVEVRCTRLWRQVWEAIKVYERSSAPTVLITALTTWVIFLGVNKYDLLSCFGACVKVYVIFQTKKKKKVKVYLRDEVALLGDNSRAVSGRCGLLLDETRLDGVLFRAPLWCVCPHGDDEKHQNTASIPSSGKHPRYNVEREKPKTLKFVSGN